MTNVLRVRVLWTSIASMLSVLATSALAQTAPPGLPAGIICYAPADQSWRVGYLQKVDKNGDALYLSPNGRLGAMVNSKGVVLEPTNRPAGLDCFGKTIDELRLKGRTLEFLPPK